MTQEIEKFIYLCFRVNKFNIICNEVNIMDNVVKYDEMVSSIPLEEGIFAGFDLGSFGGIIAVGGEV